MKDYKEDAVIAGLGRIQGFLDFKTAHWNECIRRECHMLSTCQKNFEQKQSVECIYPVELVEYEYESQTIDEIDFTAALHNNTGDSFISDILKHFRGTSTPTLAFNYGAASTRFNDESEPNQATTLTTDGREIGRAVTTNSGTDPNCVSIITFGTSIGNTLSTTITGTPASKSVFTVASVSGLAVNDCISITQTAPLGPLKRKVTNISTLTITINEDLDAIPVAGNAVNQEWTRVYLLNQATGSSLSGVMVSVAPYSCQKTSASSKAITFTLRIKGT